MESLYIPLRCIGWSINQSFDDGFLKDTMAVKRPLSPAVPLSLSLHSHFLQISTASSFLQLQRSLYSLKKKQTPEKQEGIPETNQTKRSMQNYLHTGIQTQKDLINFTYSAAAHQRSKKMFLPALYCFTEDLECAENLFKMASPAASDFCIQLWRVHCLVK